MQEAGLQDDDSHPQRRATLPPLAPRDPQYRTARDRTAGSSGSGRPPRLSHRSRAGCWTCRGRKVKCDEQHPRCGPCTRLNRDCDWDHRWNFSDATTTTQSKYTNVLTAGNVVWDATARSSSSGSPASRQADDLPAFSILTNDEDRERKAERQRPGTYGVVVTPDSFAELPEYASVGSPEVRRMSVQSSRSHFSSTASDLGLRRTSKPRDPTTVILDRFEDASPTASTSAGPTPWSRRASEPYNALQRMTISTSPNADTVPMLPQIEQYTGLDSTLLTHFRQHIAPQFMHPHQEGRLDDATTPGTTRDTFEVEATRFPVLHEAICALSALNLTHTSNLPLTVARSHYSQALRQSSTNDDLLSDGIFFRHFLLFLYDICDPMPAETDGHDLWAQHLKHLTRIVVQRRERFDVEPHGYIIWMIILLDVYACFMGKGTCEFVGTLLSKHMLPTLQQQIPTLRPNMIDNYLPDEVETFEAVIRLNQDIVIVSAKLAEAAQRFRAESDGRLVNTPGTIARWQANVAQLQGELHHTWDNAYPAFLPPTEQWLSGQILNGRVRNVFEHAFLLFQAAVIYSRTSMFPGQRTIPIANQQDLAQDTERRIATIFTLALNQVSAGRLERRYIVFPIFMAGFATVYTDAKVQALELISTMEHRGIGQNTSRVRQLLKIVYEEQTRAMETGGNGEQVDWLVIAKQRGLMVVNCGL